MDHYNLIFVNMAVILSGVIECASSFSFLLLVYVCVSAMSVIMATTTTMMGVHYIWRAKCKRSKISLVGLATAVARLYATAAMLRPRW